MLNILKKFPWRDLLLVLLLMVIDFSIHPLTFGPDRLIHDPAIYRLWDPNYLPGDWYTNMAVASHIYIFYAKVVNFYHHLRLSEEFWRMFLYLTSLGLLYYSLIRIGRIFTNNWLVVPVIALLHAALVAGSGQPIWLYGPFIQTDGGLAPRSIGVALSFLSLFFLVKDKLLWAALILGLATLIHASNSLIVFSLFLVAWIINTAFVQGWRLGRPGWKDFLWKSLRAILVYLIAGGWFALYIAKTGGSLPADFETQKFIWTWVDVRAPYMHLPLIPTQSYLRLLAHVVAILIGWWILKGRVGECYRKAINLLALVGLGAVVYFFIFYLFAFVWPWLPGFQFYSLRVVYLTYFVAYLFIALVVTVWSEGFFSRQYLAALSLLLIIALTAVFGSVPGIHSVSGKWERLRASYYQLIAVSEGSNKHVPPLYQTQLPANGTFTYLVAHPQPFMAPPNWNSGLRYLPNVASFKSFGFTAPGLADWFDRMNAMSRGQLEVAYQAQKSAGHFEPIDTSWQGQYAKLTPEEIIALGKKYNFQIFITSHEVTLPFTQLVEDSSYRLYQLPVNK